MLPDGVKYEKSSTDAVTEVSPGLLVYNPLQIYAKKALSFRIAVRIGQGASGSLVFRSFLNDFDAYCEATSAMTVRIPPTHSCYPPFPSALYHIPSSSYDSSRSRDLLRQSRGPKDPRRGKFHDGSCGNYHAFQKLFEREGARSKDGLFCFVCGRLKEDTIRIIKNFTSLIIYKRPQDSISKRKNERREEKASSVVLVVLP